MSKLVPSRGLRALGEDRGGGLNSTFSERGVITRLVPDWSGRRQLCKPNLYNEFDWILYILVNHSSEFRYFLANFATFLPPLDPLCYQF